MTIRTTTAAVFLAAALTLAGCKPDAAVKKAEVIGEGTQPVVSPAPSPDAGRIEGVIHFKGTPPAPVTLDTSMDPNCTKGGGAVQTEQVVVAGGRLANVYVFIKAGAPPSQALANAPPVVLDQKNCRYTPHVIALQQGGTVEVHNSDPTMHTTLTMPSAAGNPPLNVTQGPMGKAATQQFTQPESMLAVRCANHAWMSAFINVSATPYFAVSGTDGAFTIAGLPPGDYTLAAIHEKLGEQDIKISIPPKGTLQVDYTFAGK
jgi:hypothetical protein